MRIERTVLPVLCVLGVAVFVVLCAVFGKKQKGNEDSAEPTYPPCEAVIVSLHNELGGEMTNGDGLSSLSYRSAADGKYATVTAYMRSGVLCLSVTRPFESVKPVSTPEPTEDIFGGIGAPSETAAVSEETDEYVKALFDELIKCFSKLYVPLYDDNAAERIEEALRSMRRGDAKKANVLFGIYMLKLSFSEDDGLLFAVCEPA